MKSIDLTEALPAACRKYPSVFKTARGKQLDRSKSIGASELWGCMRSTVFQRQGADRDEGANEGLGYFERGHAVEDRFMSRLGQAIEGTGLELLYTGKDQVSITDNKSRMHATPDGLLVNRDPGPGVEIHGIILKAAERQAINVETKSLDPRSNLSKPKTHHVAQCQLQMAMWAHLGWDARHTILFYVDASDYMRLVVHVIDRDPDFLSQARGRVDRLWEIIETGVAVDAAAEGKWEGTCHYCDYQDACGEAVLSYQPLDYSELPDEIEAEMTTELETRATAARLAEYAQRQKVAAEHGIRDLMHKAGTNKALAGGKKISWQQVAGRRTLDREELADTLEAEGQDIEDDRFWKTGKASERLVITEDD